MPKDLISSESLTSENLIYERLAGSGLASPRRDTATPLYVWVLSSSILPQPGNRIGVWIDAQTWVDSNVWYD